MIKNVFVFFVVWVSALYNIVFTYVFASGLTESIDLMYTLWVTRYNTLEEFGAEKNLRRDEAAKMVVTFAKAISQLDGRTQSNNCSFSDLDKAHNDLHFYIVESCVNNLFKWYNNMFMPTRTISNAEFLAVMMRLLLWYLDEDNATHRAYAYRELASAYGLLNWTQVSNFDTLDAPISRWDTSLLLYNLYTYFKGNNIISNLWRPDLIISSISLNPEVPAPKIWADLLQTRISYMNKWNAPVIIDSRVNQGTVKMIECVDGEWAVLWSMEVYGSVTEYLLHPWDRDGSYHVDLQYLSENSPQQSGKYIIYCIVDPDNLIEETNENNNMYPFEFYVEDK